MLNHPHKSEVSLIEEKEGAAIQILPREWFKSHAGTDAVPWALLYM